MANHKRDGRYPDMKLTEGGTLIVGPENNPGHRIHEVWLYVSVDPKDGDEGVCAMMGPAGWIPMVASDERRRDLLRPKARELAKETGMRIKLRHFTSWEDVEEIEP